MSENKKPVQDFDHALKLLDHELEQLALDEPIEIRAIGGYALLKHGVREAERALTSDIDTMTNDYSAAVQQAILTVSTKTDLDPDWINNDNLGGNDPEDVAAIYDATWLPQSTGLKNISMSIADVPTLTRAKVIAADTAAFSGRSQDAPDLRRLIEFQNITTIDQFQSKYPDPFKEYPDAQALVRDHFAPQAAHSAGESEADRIKRELSASVADLDWDDDYWHSDDYDY